MDRRIFTFLLICHKRCPICPSVRSACRAVSVYHPEGPFCPLVLGPFERWCHTRSVCCPKLFGTPAFGQIILSVINKLKAVSFSGSTKEVQQNGFPSFCCLNVKMFSNLHVCACVCLCVLVCVAIKKAVFCGGKQKNEVNFFSQCSTEIKSIQSLIHLVPPRIMIGLAQSPHITLQTQQEPSVNDRKCIFSEKSEGELRKPKI